MNIRPRVPLVRAPSRVDGILIDGIRAGFRAQRWVRAWHGNAGKIILTR